MKKSFQLLLMGNEAIGRGLVEAGCSLAAAYPGTPSSEVLGSVVRFSKDATHPLHSEWSVNEKVAFETALAAACTGKRSATIMKQVGLNVAADPFTRSAYLGITGGMLVIVADDPGPHSSQTEQDSRLFALFARIPVFDPSSPAEAKQMVEIAYQLSEKYEIPVMLRPTTRICHARQNVTCEPPQIEERKAHFEKDPGRWVATPAFLPALHQKLNDKLVSIGNESNFYPKLTEFGDKTKIKTKRCIIASGIAHANAKDILGELTLSSGTDLYKVDLPYPLNTKFIQEMRAQYDEVLILEETYEVIEMQLAHPKTSGKQNGAVPRVGELTPDRIQKIIHQFLDLESAEPDAMDVAPRGQRPSLCPGCSHRASFYAIKETFPNGIFPSDIGCYTLGMNLGAVDTCHCMGACISQGAGFYRAYVQDTRDFPTIVVTIGDSTFFHAGIPALVNAVNQEARIIIAILDNSTTAMTGFQPTPQEGLTIAGATCPAVSIPKLVEACGVGFLETGDPFQHEEFTGILKRADEYIRSPNGGVAVVIAKHPCLMDKRLPQDFERFEMEINEDCIGCGECIEEFECPALFMDEESELAEINFDLCVRCGNCVPACPTGAIVRKEIASS